MRLEQEITFGGEGLDRAAALRGDDTAQARMLADPEARILPLWRAKPLVAGEGDLSLALVPPGHACLDQARERPFFLGLTPQGPRFAADISAWEPPAQEDGAGTYLDMTEQHHPDAPTGARFAELRVIMTRLGPLDAALAATARGLIEWHRTHPFCARCGQASLPAQAGWQHVCPACGAQHFPRTDPVVIMLITHGNSVLMGRAPIWPEGMFSLLAGFVEPGETIEAAVRREVMEEAGVPVGAVSYLASQPWPFPASLMLGCRGEALARDIRIDPEELEDARWMSREEVLAALAGDLPGVVPARPGAIARSLLEGWLADRLA
ncbi:MAG: NAD(+) diphosphatase [Tropicimonas sp.]|uniref:NAD(+) diphosphatase n=1 Tax=Tropicimonas sp. TaxID=2067044 RepID=UPI003A8BA6FC